MNKTKKVLYQGDFCFFMQNPYELQACVFICTIQLISPSGNIPTFKAFIQPSTVRPPHIIPHVLRSQAVQTLPLNIHTMPRTIHTSPSESISAVFKYNLPPTLLIPQDRSCTHFSKIYRSHTHSFLKSSPQAHIFSPVKYAPFSIL